MKNKHYLWLLLILILVLSCAACSNSNDNADDNSGFVVYNHEYSGATLNVPAAWELEKEDKYYALFSSEDSAISFGFLFEPGSYAYYSAVEMAKQVGKIINGLDEQNYKCQVIEELDFSKVIGNSAIKVLAHGFDGNDTNFMIDFVECSPLTGVRYYMFTVTDVATYEENIDMIDSVYESFKLTKTNAEIYQLLNEKE